MVFLYYACYITCAVFHGVTVLSLVYGCFVHVWLCRCVYISMSLTTDSDSGVQVHNLRWIWCCAAHTQCRRGGGDTGE